MKKYIKNREWIKNYLYMHLMTGEERYSDKCAKLMTVDNSLPEFTKLYLSLLEVYESSYREAPTEKKFKFLIEMTRILDFNNFIVANTVQIDNLLTYIENEVERTA